MANPSSGLFHLVMIKPSHYDDDGYPIQWFRSAIPSNTLACLNGLAEDARRRQVLGDVDIRLHTYDETNRRVRPDRIIRMIRRAGGKALIALVGVQSNQFPRSVDLARPFLAAGLPVCIGGFHISGCIAMLPETPKEIRDAQDLGISFFAGEAEDGRLDEVLLDAFNDSLKPLYNYMDDLPALEGQPPPALPKKIVQRTLGAISSLDLGRGCPYQCSFCTIINVQGRKSRIRNADDLERAVRENYAQGIKRFFITDDNFARNQRWEELCDRMIKMKVDEGMDIGFTIQVDTLCHKIPNFIEKATKGGARRIFIGLENINPDNLIGAKKRQNKITDYREMLQKWRAHGALTFAGYILGFPGDTKESILSDIEIIKRELPVDILEFFYLTPLPGSEDHKVLWQKGTWMDPDLNKYDLTHRVSHHPKNVGPGMGRSLPRRLERLLHARAHPHDYAPGRRHQVRNAQLHHLNAAVVQHHDPIGECAPVGRRHVPPEIPARPPFGLADRKSVRLLSALAHGACGQGPRLLVGLPAFQRDQARGRGGARSLELQRRRHRSAAGERARIPRSLPRHQGRRGRARAQAAQRRHPCHRPCV